MRSDRSKGPLRALIGVVGNPTCRQNWIDMQGLRLTSSLRTRAASSALGAVRAPVTRPQFTATVLQPG
jgi:hypothetical protein